MTNQGVFIGTDSGATTSKTGGVWTDGSIISTKLLQSSTNSQLGTAAVVKGWVEGVSGFLSQNQLTWAQVQGVGLAIGTQAGPARIRDIVTAAGFTQFRIAAQTPFNNVLEVRK